MSHAVEAGYYTRDGPVDLGPPNALKWKITDEHVHEARTEKRRFIIRLGADRARPWEVESFYTMIGVEQRLGAYYAPTLYGAKKLAQCFADQP